VYVCSNVSEVSVLVPGAGLGRLAYEIARLGYICQGNEFSLFMLFASNFILNKLVSHPAYIVEYICIIASSIIAFMFICLIR